MKISWYKKAERQLDIILAQCQQDFGTKVTLRFIDLLDSKQSRLLANPEMGFPEPLLAGRKRLYRAIVVRPHFKLIYWWNERRDTIHIADIWDSRREPSSLSARI